MAKRVLIAEDEPSIVTSLEFLMGRSGYETRGARDGEEALALLATFRPHLVLLDIMLPRRSGLELCRLIRADAVARRHASPHADRHGRQPRRRAGPRGRRGRLPHQAVLDPGAGGARAGACWRIPSCGWRPGHAKEGA